MARKYLNNYVTALTAALAAGATTMTVGTAPDALTPGDTYRLLISLRSTSGVLTKKEFVDVTAISGNDLTITRGVEGSTDQDWDAGARVELVETAETFNNVDLSNYLQKSGDTLTDGTIQEYTEPVYTASSGAFDRTNGGVQFYTLTASESLTFTMDNGQDMELHLFGTATYTGSWPAGTKFDGGSPPDLSTATEAVLEVFKRGGNLYVAYVGDYS